MNRLTELADRLKGTKSHPDFLAALDETITLLRAAAQETVGTEWKTSGLTLRIWEGDREDIFTMSNERCPGTVAGFHHADLHAARLAIASAKAERDAALKKTAVTLGVGDGTGSLYVHGDYDSIKACQAKLLERETALASLAEAKQNETLLQTALLQNTQLNEALACKEEELRMAYDDRDAKRGELEAAEQHNLILRKRIDEFHVTLVAKQRAIDEALAHAPHGGLMAPILRPHASQATNHSAVPNGSTPSELAEFKRLADELDKNLRELVEKQVAIDEAMKAYILSSETSRTADLMASRLREHTTKDESVEKARSLIRPHATKATAAKPACVLCGEPMCPGEEMFQYHGFSGPCPTPATTPTAAGATTAADACDTRELVARLATSIVKDREQNYHGNEFVNDLEAIAADARRGGVA